MRVSRITHFKCFAFVTEVETTAKGVKIECTDMNGMGFRLKDNTTMPELQDVLIEMTKSIRDHANKWFDANPDCQTLQNMGFS